MKILLIVGSLFLAGCGPHMTLLVHPKTGERKECRAGINQYGDPVGQDVRLNCVQQYGALGFIEVEKLTPEQRDSIIPRASATTIKIEK